MATAVIIYCIEEPASLFLKKLARDVYFFARRELLLLPPFSHFCQGHLKLVVCGTLLFLLKLWVALSCGRFTCLPVLSALLKIGESYIEAQPHLLGLTLFFLGLDLLPLLLVCCMPLGYATDLCSVVPP